MILNKTAFQATIKNQIILRCWVALYACLQLCFTAMTFLSELHLV